MRRVVLWNMPDEIMLIVEHENGVIYQNQVGGPACWQGEMQGVLSPLDLDAEQAKLIQQLPFLSGRAGISSEIADAIDSALHGDPSTRFLKVDRSRLDESFEAWIYVLVDSRESDSSSESEPFFGPAYGFGRARGVLTWPNSD